MELLKTLWTSTEMKKKPSQWVVLLRLKTKLHVNLNAEHDQSKVGSDIYLDPWKQVNC